MKHRVADIEYNGGYDVYEDPADYIEDISDFYVESWDIEEHWRRCESLRGLLVSAKRARGAVMPSVPCRGRGRGAESEINLIKGEVLSDLRCKKRSGRTEQHDRREKGFF